MNRAEFIGNLGRAADWKEYGDGERMLKFSIGVKDRKKNTTWVDCTLFGSRAEALSEYLTKGKQVFVAGEVSVRPYLKDGDPRASMQVIVNELELLGGGGGDKRESAPPPRQRRRERREDTYDDDRPLGNFPEDENELPF